MINFGKFKATAARIRDEMQELDEQIAAIPRERAEVQAAPLPRDDFADLIIETIEQAACGYVEQLHNDLRQFVAPSSMDAEYSALKLSGAVLCTGQPPALPYGGLPLEGKSLSLPAVWHLFGDLIKPKVREAIAAMPDYPENVGLPRAARAAKVDELNKHLRDLNFKRTRLLQEVREAGIRLETKDERSLQDIREYAIDPA